MTSKTLFQNTFILRRLIAFNLANIIKIATLFIKKNLKAQTKLKEL